MKKTVTRFTRRIFGKATEQTTEMSHKRYFINQLPDFEETDGTVDISESCIKKSIHNILDSICKNFKPSESNGNDGLYLGTAGISYMFYHLSNVPLFSEERIQLLNNAIEYLKPALKVAAKQTRRKRDVPSFILGNCGIYAIASAIFHLTDDAEQSTHYKNLYFDAANVCKEMRFLDCGSDELFVGRAGYLCGAIWLSKTLNIQPPLQDLHEICRITVASGREYALRNRSPSPLMYAYYRVEYLGAAHGLCSILQMLMSVPGYLDANPADAKAIQQSVDYLLSLQDDEGNFPAATDEVHRSHNELVHWCHGAPGVVYLMAKAYLVWKDEKYIKSCEKMAEIIWKKGLLKKGPGICHGVAGNGYVFLLMYRLTNKPKYLHRAYYFSKFLELDKFKREARTPDHPYSLYEGIAGTACFLADLTNPTVAAFPFCDVF